MVSHHMLSRASIKMITEAGDWGHTFTMFGIYIRCLPREVLDRVLVQKSGSIQEINVAFVATNNALYVWSGEEDMHPLICVAHS